MLQRLFIAFPLPRQVIGHITTIERQWRHQYPGVRWISPDMAHITVNFLGGTDGQKIPELKEIIRSATETVSNIPLILEGPGAFPNTEKAKVIYLNVKEPISEPMRALQRRLSRLLIENGFNIDGKKWAPHITLGRLKTSRRIILKIPASKELSWLATKICLMESQLGPAGPQYRILESLQLQP